MNKKWFQLLMEFLSTTAQWTKYFSRVFHLVFILHHIQRKAYFGLSSILGANIDPPSSSQESLHNTTIDTEYILHRFT